MQRILSTMTCLSEMSVSHNPAVDGATRTEILKSVPRLMVLNSVSDLPACLELDIVVIHSIYTNGQNLLAYWEVFRKGLGHSNEFSTRGDIKTTTNKLPSDLFE